MRDLNARLRSGSGRSAPRTAATALNVEGSWHPTFVQRCAGAAKPRSTRSAPIRSVWSSSGCGWRVRLSLNSQTILAGLETAWGLRWLGCERMAGICHGAVPTAERGWTARQSFAPPTISRPDHSVNTRLSSAFRQQVAANPPPALAAACSNTSGPKAASLFSRGVDGPGVPPRRYRPST
jgi:hypothetical protein